MDRRRKNGQLSGEDSEEEVQSIYREMPFEFKNFMRAYRRDKSLFIDDGVLVIQKPLSKRDVDPKKGRFSFPSDRLGRNYRQNNGFIDLIEPSAQNITTVYFRVKKKKKKKNSGKDSIMYVLDTFWNQVVTRNNLEAGQIVQLWAVGMDRKYCFALHRLTTEGNTAPGGNAAAANPSSSSSSSDS